MSERSDRIVKNTIMLYVRSILIMVLAIYTSRVLLSTLGVNNYGVYSVVGGIVAMFSSIKSVLAAAVQRFINYEKGKGNSEVVNIIFSSSVIIHIVLTILFIIIIEPVGLWYINNHLVLPENSFSNAIFVFHCSVAATAFTIITIPFDALVIANERMEFFAWISIAEAVLKLLIIFLLPILPFQYLKSYAFLILLLTLSQRIIVFFYCRIFPEAKFRFVIDKQELKEMGAFAGWNFFGCTASSLIEEGSNLILNAFGGVVANAARGIAYQIKSAVTTLTNNVVVASQPYITQQSATVEKEKFFSYIFLQTRIVFYATALIVLPIYIYAPELLDLWLINVPEFAPEFVRAVLIYVVVMSFSKSIDLAFKSYGKIAKYQILDTLILIITLPIVYCILKVQLPMHFAFYGFSIIKIIDYIAIVVLAEHEIGLSKRDFCLQAVLPAMKAMIIMVCVAALFMRFFKASGIVTLLMLILLIVALTSVFIYLFVLKTDEKKIVLNLLGRITKTKFK